MLSNFINKSEVPLFSDYIRHHNNFKVSANYKETHKQRQAIIATVLGDGSILYPYKGAGTPRLVWNMGNKEHAEYKRDFFEFLDCKLKEKDNTGFGKNWYCLSTRAHPLIKKFHDELYVGTKKNITRDWVYELDEIGWAWLYGDDGNLSNECCRIHTEGYGKEISQIYADAINIFTKTDGAVVSKYFGGTPKKERFYVRCNRNTSREFIKRVGPHMATGMEYKLGKGYIS